MAVLRLLKCLVIVSAAAFVLPELALAEVQENETGRESPSQSAAAVLSDGKYQSDLPNLPPLRESIPSRSDDGAPEFEAPPVETPRDTSEPTNFDKTWLWFAAAVVGALLLAYIVLTWVRAKRRPAAASILKSRRRKSAKSESAPTPPAAPIKAPTILDEADRLAGEGRYGDAIHFLLLNSLDTLGRRARRRIPPSLTNREILNVHPMAENIAGALSILVPLAERSHFGGALLSAADYGLCRDKFQIFALDGGRAS